MRYISRTPDFKVSIVRPNYTSGGAYRETTVAEFASSDTNEALIGYSFNQDVMSFESPFSLTVLPVHIGNTKKSLMDIVQANDLVKIEEFGELKYLGVTNASRYSARMDDRAPSRTITISGHGVAGIIDRFQVLLDITILAQNADNTLEGYNKSLMEKLSAQYQTGHSIVDMLTTIQASFKEVMEKIGRYDKGTGIFKVVDQYLAFSDDSKKLQLKYPFSGDIFTYGGMSLGQIFQGCVFKPLQEFFVRWDEKKKKYLFVLRPTPFSPEAWKGLRRTEIDPLIVSSCDLGFSDVDVKTWFFAFLLGGATPYDVARAPYINQSIISPISSTINAEERAALSRKWSMYGYRPLEASFKYVNMSELDDKNSSIVVPKSAVVGDVVPDGGALDDKQIMAAYSKQMYEWFRRSDEMLSGSIEIHTTKESPRIGERVFFHGAEFYVESVSGSWQYGGEMSSNLKVTRGGVYNSGFRAGSPETDKNWFFRKLPNVGDKIGTDTVNMQDGGVK